MTENSIQTIKKYAMSPEVVERFRDVSGPNAMAYISSALLAVSNSRQLQECTPVSIMSSALRAATLRLSCDPSTGQAYLIPFKNQCTLIVGYKGLKDMALRTGKYRHLNVGRVYNGEQVLEDRLKGIHSIVGSKIDDTVIGYILYFELLTGYSKTFYMTVEELQDHALEYSKGIGRDDSLWKTNFDAMAKKTLVRLGLAKWGYLDPYDAQIFATDNVTGDIYEMPHNVTIVEDEPIAKQQAIDDLYGTPSPNDNGHKTTDREQPTLLDEAVSLGGVVVLRKQREDKWPADAKVSFETACTILSSDGTPYVDLTDKDLDGRSIGLKKKLAANGLTPEERADYQMKLDTIEAIKAAK